MASLYKEKRFYNFREIILNGAEKFADNTAYVVKKAKANISTSSTLTSRNTTTLSAHTLLKKVCLARRLPLWVQTASSGHSVTCVQQQ